MNEREASGACAFAGLWSDRELERPRLRASGEGVEFAVQILRLAGEDGDELLAVGRSEVRAGVLDVLGGVEHGAVVDPYGVGVLVFDDGAVHECAEVPQRLVVQVAAADPLGDRLGEVGCDLVHVGETVCHRDRQLLADRSLGDALADRLGEGQLTAQVVRPFGRDA